MTNKDTHIEKCLAAYDRVLDIFKTNNDNYFKRTQIAMILAQSALFVAFGKVFALEPKKFKPFLLSQTWALVAITVLGIVFAVIWLVFIRRQCNVLALCKSYLRGIENYLMEHGVPLGYWAYEGRLSHPVPKCKQPFADFTMDPNFFTVSPSPLPFPLKNYDCSQYDHKQESRNQIPGKKREWRFPKMRDFKMRERGNRKRFYIALTRIERVIAYLLLAVWFSLFSMLVASRWF